VYPIAKGAPDLASVPTMYQGLFVPPFGQLSDPWALSDLAIGAEEAGFDGFFIWDHILRPQQDLAVADPWVALAAVATRTERLKLGPLITPVSRRRPQKLARETVTLSRLSRGRLVLGVGLGVNTGGELTRFREVDDDRLRAERLDEGLALLTKLWSGEPVSHEGPHFFADGVRFLPTPGGSGIPIWVAARSPRPAIMARAARYDGLCPETTPDGLREMLRLIAAERGNLEGFDVVARGKKGDDPGPWLSAGATWWLQQVGSDAGVRQVEALIEHGPVQL
jgi:alkanesulfonate monooxygenase SsuD/methylene tetrahydromethanopterin reductase-like flavin-dependent oxidoreductase (luciferase family)